MNFKKIIKLFDFLYQAIPIFWIYPPVLLGITTGQGLLILIIPFIFILPYQILSSVYLIFYKFFERKLNKIILIRFCICILILFSLILLVYSNQNCRFIEDVLTFSNIHLEEYTKYYEIHKGKPFITPICRQVIASNNIFTREVFLIMFIVPIFFLLTIIERLKDIRITSPSPKPPL